MRMAALLRPALAGISFLSSCTPREDVAGYSAGVGAMDTPALQPADAPPADAPPTDAPPADPSAAPPEEPEAQDTSANPSGSSDSEPEPAPVEEQAQPTQLAGGSMQSAPPAPEGPAAVDPEPEPTPPSEQPPSEPPAEPPEAAPPAVAPGFRFVRLIADTDVTQGPLTSLAEFSLLGPDRQPLARDGWLATADSAEQVWVGGAPAILAIDGDPNTMWHTPWFQVVPPPHPHFLQVDLGAPRQLSAFRILARQDGAPDGRIAAFRFYVSTDGVDWGTPVAAGTLTNSALPQDVSIGQ